MLGKIFLGLTMCCGDETMLTQPYTRTIYYCTNVLDFYFYILALWTLMCVTKGLSWFETLFVQNFGKVGLTLTGLQVCVLSFSAFLYNCLNLSQYVSVSVSLSLCLPVSLCLSLFVCPSACLSFSPSLCYTTKHTILNNEVLNFREILWISNKWSHSISTSVNIKTAVAYIRAGNQPSVFHLSRKISLLKRNARLYNSEALVSRQGVSSNFFVICGISSSRGYCIQM